jgi:hypothetical protein
MGNNDDIYAGVCGFKSEIWEMTAVRDRCSYIINLCKQVTLPVCPWFANPQLQHFFLRLIAALWAGKLVA